MLNPESFMKKTLIVLLLPFILLTGCDSGTQEVEQKAELQQQVMAVHDSAMAEMDNIFKMRRNLRTLRDSLQIQLADTAIVSSLNKQISGLNMADEGMMDWMRNYKAPDTLQHERAMQYLQLELQKINRVKNFMDSTLKAAHKTYQQHEKPE
jgi:hypothetical protein